MISNNKKEQISFSVIKTLVKKFKDFPVDAIGNRNAPFQEAFLNAFSNSLDGKVQDIPFFISLSSWLHGLNTSLGQSFFESVAHTLSDGSKKSFTAKKDTLLEVKPAQRNSIADIITDLENSVHLPNLARENTFIYIINTQTYVDAEGFTIDVYVETNDEILAIELKTVKPNSAGLKVEKRKILEAKAALFNRFPGKAINFYLGFPFDPLSSTPTGYDKNRFLDHPIGLRKFFALDEFLLGEELWDTLSGDTDTMSQILDIINTIATTDFLTLLNYLNDQTKRDEAKYKNLLKLWNLHSEIELIDNQATIIAKSPGNKIAQTKYNQDIFKNGGVYNYPRYSVLRNLIN